VDVTEADEGCGLLVLASSVFVGDRGPGSSEAVVKAAEMFDRALRRRDSAWRRAEEAMLWDEKRLGKALGGMSLSVAAPCRTDGPVRSPGKAGRSMWSAPDAWPSRLRWGAWLCCRHRGRLRSAAADAADAADRLLDHGPPVSSCLAGSSPRYAKLVRGRHPPPQRRHRPATPDLRPPGGPGRVSCWH
jgi:hypothetical protein